MAECCPPTDTATTCLVSNCFDFTTSGSSLSSSSPWPKALFVAEPHEYIVPALEREGGGRGNEGGKGTREGRERGGKGRKEDREEREKRREGKGWKEEWKEWMRGRKEEEWKRERREKRKDREGRNVKHCKFPFPGNQTKVNFWIIGTISDQSYNSQLSDSLSCSSHGEFLKKLKPWREKEAIPSRSRCSS